MQKLTKVLKIIIPIIILISLITGCTNIKSNNSLSPRYQKTAYFHKGTYKSFSPDKKNPYKGYLYIFYDEYSGHTEESEIGIGLPFSCIQTEGSVKFKFGGAEEPEKIFKIKSVENNVITGSFEDGQLLKFIPIPN